jgi:hypothetical protein
LNGETWFEPLLMDGALGPDEGAGIVIVVGDKAVDVGDQFGPSGEGRTLFELRLPIVVEQGALALRR